MSDFGMRMPGGQQVRKARPDVYTGLMFVAMLALGAACAVVYLNGQKVGPDGNALAIQESNSIRLSNP